MIEMVHTERRSLMHKINAWAIALCVLENVKSLIIELLFVEFWSIVVPCAVNVPCRRSDTAAITKHEPVIQSRCEFWHLDFREATVRAHNLLRTISKRQSTRGYRCEKCRI
ncbi:MAG: hypothetical protein FWH36_03055 [Lentimicrobiaceae bacterium]|nr:hypothetical protein [Lentimicrobiaceae bacterium]